MDITRAGLVSEYEQRDFIMSLTGEKKISYMPTEVEIADMLEESEEIIDELEKE